MNKYCYCVNTFKGEELEVVQICGDIYAESEKDAVRKLIKGGTVDSHGYEFLELRKEDYDRI